MYKMRGNTHNHNHTAGGDGGCGDYGGCGELEGMEGGGGVSAWLSAWLHPTWRESLPPELTVQTQTAAGGGRNRVS